MQDILNQPHKKKINWADLLTYTLRLIIGMGLGIILSVVSQEIWSLGKISTLFIILTCVFLIKRLTKNWSLAKVIILGVNFILFFLFLHTYIMVAPGA